MYGCFIVATPKSGNGKQLWLTMTGDYSPNSWKAHKFPEDFNFDLAFEVLERKYTTFHFDRSY